MASLHERYRRVSVILLWLTGVSVTFALVMLVVDSTRRRPLTVIWEVFLLVANVWTLARLHYVWHRLKDKPDPDEEAQ